MKERGIRGRRIGHVRASRRYADDRKCAHSGCPARLSRYNPGNKCWTHAGFKVPRLRGKVEDQPG